MSFCTVGAPLTPIAPTSSPSTLIGRPPPYAATRASVGMPAKSDGSRWMKSKKSCVGTPNRAVYALFCAISMLRIGAPSMRRKALRLPPSSRTATFSDTPIVRAFATASSTICCASSEEILCFLITLAIGLSPFRLLRPHAGNTASSLDVGLLRWKAIPEHRPSAFGVRHRRFVLDHVPMLDQESIDDPNEVRHDP